MKGKRVKLAVSVFDDLTSIQWQVRQGEIELPHLVLLLTAGKMGCSWSSRHTQRPKISKRGGKNVPLNDAIAIRME
jgi:hypothetical protein